MLILAIDTSCDETAVAVSRNTKVVSNCVWSQASLHSSFGGVFPSLAQRQHQERIDWVIEKALTQANCTLSSVDCVAVTVGKGLAIALSVGVNKAKDLARSHNKPLIPISHIEAHLLSPFATSKSQTADHKSSIIFPTFGLVLSGGTTLLCLIKNIGDYEVVAETTDDAIGEALDKGARLLGLGYPGAAVLEKFARLGTPRYKLPLPLQHDIIKNRFSYSGLKTAFLRLTESVTNPTKQDIYDLASSFQSTAFDHIEKVIEYQVLNSKLEINSLLFGGGVANNIQIRKRLRRLCNKHGIQLHVPYNKKLNGDNAGMIGVCAYLKNKDLSARDLATKFGGRVIEEVDINPKLLI